MTQWPKTKDRRTNNDLQNIKHQIKERTALK